MPYNQHLFVDSILAGTPGVLSGPFMHGLTSPLGAPYPGGVAGVPGLNSFALGQTAPALRGLGTPGLALATVLLVSNLNEEVCMHFQNYNLVVVVMCSLYGLVYLPG